MTKTKRLPTDLSRFRGSGSDLAELLYESKRRWHERERRRSLAYKFAVLDEMRRLWFEGDSPFTDRE